MTGVASLEAKRAPATNDRLNHFADARNNSISKGKVGYIDLEFGYYENDTKMRLGRDIPEWRPL